MKKKASKIFHENLIKYRKAKGFTQAKLAELTGISRRAIAHYESCETNPPLDNVVSIAKALKISFDELIGESAATKGVDLFYDIDMRTLRKIILIKDLPKKDRATIYNTIDAMLEKNKLPLSS